MIDFKEQRLTMGMVKEYLVQEAKKELMGDIKRTEKLGYKVDELIEKVNLIVETLGHLHIKLPSHIYTIEKEEH